MQPTLGKYILKGKKPVREYDLMKWAEWFETADRHVADDYLATLDGEIRVSTVFLGLDHNFSGIGAPLLFETMVFSGPRNNEMIRSSSWRKALAAHKYMVQTVKDEQKTS